MKSWALCISKVISFPRNLERGYCQQVREPRLRGMSEGHIGGEWQVLIYSQASVAAWPMCLPLERRGPGVNGNKKAVSGGGARAVGLMWGGGSCGTLPPVEGEGLVAHPVGMCGDRSDATW